MDERATGLILRTRPLTETSLIVHWLCAEAGRVATVAKGARRPKSPFRGKLDLFFLADFNFLRSRRSDLHILREVSLKDTHSELRRDLGRLQQAAYAAALIELATETETPLPGPFQLLIALLAQLKAGPPLARTIIAFELKLLEDLGLRPDLEHSTLTAGCRLAARHLASDDWAALSRLQLSAPQIGEMREFLGGFMIHHLGKIPASRPGAFGADESGPAQL